MQHKTPGAMLDGLPLIPEQYGEVLHYIHRQERAGKAWDTPELKAMLADMLDPPEALAYSQVDADDSTSTERLSAGCEDGDEPLQH